MNRMGTGVGSHRVARAVACLASATVAGAAGAVSPGADPTPGQRTTLELRVVVDDCEIVIDPYECGMVEHREDGSRRLRGSHEVDRFVRIDWDATIGFAPFIFATYVVSNTSQIPSAYTLTATLPLGTPIAQAQVVGSGCATVVAGGVGGRFGAMPGDTFVYGRIDGEVLPETTGLLPAGFAIDAGPFDTHTIGPVSFGLAGTPILVDEIDDTIGLTLGFSLPVGATINIGAWMLVEPVDDASPPKPEGFEPPAISAAAMKEVK